MNKVFKVIWSEARNAYVVVSEIAKNHGSKSCSTKKLLAMLIATGVMTCASVAPVMAANPAPNDTQIAVGKDAKANGGDSVAIGNGAEAKAANGIAIGYKSLSGDRGWGVAIGGNTQAIGTYSVALGQTAKALEYEGIAIGHTSLSEGSGAIAIGRSTNAKGAASLAFGNDAKALNEASIAFGQGSNSSGNGSIAVGRSSKANGTNSIAIGNQAITSKDYSVVIGGHTYKGTTGTGVTGVGQQTQVLGDYSAAFGMTAKANVDRATAIGSYANAMAAGSVALGAGSTVSRGAGVQGYDPLTGDTSANTHPVWKSTKGAVSVGGVGVTRQIINVAAGSEDADAVNVAQLKKVNEEALKHTTLSDGKNTTVVPTVEDGQTDYKVNVAGDLTDISSVANGDAKLALNGAAGTAGIANGKGASVYMQDGYTVINSKVSFDQDGKISGVAAGINDNDAVNVGQLKAVGATANMGWNLATNGVATEATNVKPGDFVDFSGDKNISVSHDGTKVKVGLNKGIDVNSVQTNALNSKYNLSVGTMAENGIMPFFVNSTGDFYAAHNKFSVDKDGKVTATAGEIGNVVLNNGVLYKNSALRDGELFIGDVDGNYSQITPKSAKLGKVTIDKDGKISGVAAGAITADSTDAVNGSQLHAVATEAGKHSKVVNGNNTNVEETTVDGQKVYKVNLNNNIMVGDVTGKYVSISGTNGTIEATGAITTKDRVHADNGAKLADIDVTGDTISNGDAKLALNGAAGTAGMINGKGASVYMQDGYTVINSKVSFDQDGKISGVAAGINDNDAVNVGQLKAVGATANMGWNLATNGVATEATNVKPGDFVDFSGDKNISVSHDGTKVKVGLNKGIDVNSVQTNALNSKYNLSVGTANVNGTMPFFVNSNGAFYAANGKLVVDKDGKLVAPEAELGKVTADEGEIGNVVLKNGVYTGNSALRDGELLVGDASGNYSQITPKSAKLGKVTIDKDGKISGVAAGINDNDAVNVGQLKAVGATANMGWNLATNGVATEATNVKPGDFVDFSGDKNISVSHDGTKVKVELNKNIDVNYVQTNALNAKYNLSVGTANENGTVPFFVNSNGAFYAANGKLVVDKDGKVTATEGEIGNVVLKNGVLYKNTALRDGELYVGDADGNYSQITPKSAKLGQVTIDEKGNMAGVNSIQTNALNAKYNLSVGTANENGTVPFFVNSNGAFYAANGKLVVDKDGKVTATEGEIGNVVLKNGVLYKNTALRDGELYVGDASGNYSQITTKGAKLGKVTVAADGKISGVAAGAVTADSTDAVNGSQLHAVATEAGKHSKVVNGSNINVEETDLDGQKVYKVNLNKDIMLGDLTGKNVSISGTNGTIEATGAITTKDRVYADNGAKLADIDVTGDTISNGDAKLALNGAAGTAGMINGKGASVYMQDGYTVINSKVAFDQNGKISGVAAGAVTADSTDAVNGSQLHAVATEAGKHSKVVSGNNINVEETDVDGQKFYKVNMNKDIMLGDLTGKNVSISGTNGTIEATGAIATKDRVYADNGAKLADIDVTGNKISNGASSIVLDGSNVKVNDKVTIDQDGKISGVAAGEISSTSTDAINGSQLKETNDRVAANETAIKNNTEAISKLDGRVTANETAIKNNADAIGNLNTRVDGVEKLAKQHTTVAAAGDNITVTEDTNKDGGKEYKVALDKDINLDSVTTGQTVMNNDGLKVGKDVSVTATAVTAGQTSISNDGLKVNGKTYVSDSGLNANDQKITKVADGDISETSKDAVNGSQLYKTNQEVANNATNISSLSHSISNLDNRVNKVGAGAAALAALHPLDFDPDAKWDFAAGYGNYRGANAAAVGAYYRPNEDTMFSVGGTFGNGENMVNAGVSFKLGSGSNHVSTSRVAMAKEIKELRGELEAMKSAMLDANAGKKIDTSKLQLFPDVPQNHWAYEYVAQLAGNGMIEGYPDGNFAGDRPMTRYEFAAILYRAMTKGAVLSDKILSEFSHELEYFTVDTIAKDKAGNPTIQRVRTVKENKNK